MLRVEVCDRLLNALHRAALADDYDGGITDLELMAVRSAVTSFCRRFNDFQDRAGTRLIGDGRAGTIRDAVGPATGDHGWPSRNGRLLQSLLLDSTIKIPANIKDAGSESYMCEMTVGPPMARRFGRFTTVFLYLDGRRRGYVCWIGRSEDLGDGFRFVISQTGDFQDFSVLDP